MVGGHSEEGIHLSTPRKFRHSFSPPRRCFSVQLSRSKVDIAGL